MSVGTLTPRVRRPPAGLRGEHARAALASPAALGLAGLTILAAVLRFAYIGHQGFWFDEANTALLVHFSPGKMIGLIPQTESTPPLYYCLAWVWARVFGYGEAGLRSLSALAGVLTIPVAYGAAQQLISRRAGLVAAALTACNPFLIWYSQEARSYALLVLLTAVALLAFAHARSNPTPRILAAWVIASGLALATHYYALLAIVPQAIWLLAVHWRRRRVQLAVGAVALCGLALIPLAINQNGTGHASWIAPIPLGLRLGQIIPQFLIGPGAPAQGVLEPVAAAMVIVALVLLATRSDAIERRRGLAAGALAVGGLALNLLLVAGGVDDLITRNVIVIWLPAALMVAAGLGSIGRPARHPASPEGASIESSSSRAGLIGLLATVVLCATGIVAAVGVAVDRNLERPDWRVVARALGPRPPAGAPGRAILVQDYRDLLPLSLYLPGLKAVHRSAVKVSELDVVSISAPRVRLCWWGAACNLSGSRMQRVYSIPGFHVLWRRRALQFTILRLVSATPRVLTAREVGRALTATTLRHDELLFQRP